MENLLKEILFLTIWIIIWYLLAKIYFYIKLHKERKKAIQNSKKSIIWEVNEKLAPMLPNFKYKPKDLVFIWKWFDYLVLDWLSEWNLKQIIFLEIKSWKSTLNKNEKQIKQTIENKKVKYEIYKQV